MSVPLPHLHHLPLDFFVRNRPQFDRADFPVKQHLKTGLYPQRMMRYYIANEAAASEARLRASKLTLVDLGCERGLLKMLCSGAFEAHWCGLDWNLGRPSLKAAADDELHQADFDKPLPVPDAYADVVVSLHVFEHLPRPKFTVSEVRRVLKPGGVFVFGVPVAPPVFAAIREIQYRREVVTGDRRVGRHINKFTPGRVRDMLETSGFRLEWETGTHLFRWSGSFFENSVTWLRINQMWGRLLPTLGREFYVVGRKPAAVAG